VDKSKGGAGDVLGAGSGKAFGDAFDESGFSGPEVAAQKDDEGRGEFSGEGASEGDGLIGGVGNSFGGGHSLLLEV
jgi:hypothetical protein